MQKEVSKHELILRWFLSYNFNFFLGVFGDFLLRNRFLIDGFPFLPRFLMEGISTSTMEEGKI